MKNFRSFINELFSLEGKVAVIIGGGGHICSALAEGYALAGASLSIVDLKLEKALKISNNIKFKYGTQSISIEADAGKEDSLKNALSLTLKEFSKIDILINGAGKNSPKPFLEIPIEEWNDVMNSQITATMLGCKIFGSQMLKQKSGSIINISSASAGPPLSKAFAYSVAKAGIKNLTMNLAREWATENVRVNAIRPGFFPTEWNKKNFINPEREKAIMNHTPMKRFGEPHELIGSAIWLASDSSNFVTGAEITVDGGFSCMTI
ncbi:MAG: gluconate 5-dehydrogenase [Flavobacteriaceae bacterium]|nr:gluconate 5-dehydrogenase [Flavobacteriaceae bacterium]